MDMTFLVAIVSVTGTAIVGAGLVKTWRKNGKDQRTRDVGIAEERSKRDQRIQSELVAIKECQEENTKRATETKEAVIEQARKCAGYTATFTERTRDIEGRVKNLEAKTR